ncbi:Phosphatidylethanolamine-binding protein [Cinara cedri]|uniref:Phosphatidylethanolamine-binding protein n=1 Tax=Cinara cedri TaxID=506608 RepID=A0A5E4MSV8_9HEMI|nr:Phosphatidylethanolamine-binding protein [Cinara cedri]
MWKLTALGLICVFVAIGDAYWFCKTTNNIVRAFEKYNFGKNISNGLPCKKLLVTYFECSVEVKMGNVLKSLEVEDAPSVHWEWADEDKNYTLIFTDADYQNHKNSKHEEFILWMVVNIPGNHVNYGEEIVEYIPPKPKNKTELHRCIFLVFEQEDGKYDFDDVIHIKKNNIDARRNFSTNKFVLQNNLILVPTGGNFFLAKYSAPDAHKNC